MFVDPLAEQFVGWTPYHYVHQNPINLIDPTGMSAELSSNPPPDEIMEDTLLPEIVINVNRKVTGTAQGAHGVRSDKGERFYGYRLDGVAEGKYGGVNGHLSGFSFGYEAFTESGGIHGSSSVYALTANGGFRLGTENTNFSMRAEGSIFMAEINDDAGFYTGTGGNCGAELGADAGAYTFKGEVTPSVTIFGINLGITIGGSLGSAYIGGRSAAKFNSDTKEFEATAKAHIGLGAGLKLGLTISNTKQEIYGQKKQKKSK